MCDLPTTIDDFLKSSVKNAHLSFQSENGGEVYLYARKSMRYLKNIGYLSAFDIASIDVEYPGRKTFSVLLDTLEKSLSSETFTMIFVESIVNTNFEAFLRKRNYLDYREDQVISPSLYKMLEPRK